MTIAQAIAAASKLRESDIPEDMMVGWLSKLDGQIYVDVIQQHIGGTTIPMPDYGPGTDVETELLVPHPWDELYVYFLAMRIDMAQGEMELANADNIVYMELYQQWVNSYTRTHRQRSMPALMF